MLRQALAAPSRTLRPALRAASHRWPASNPQFCSLPLPAACRTSRTASSTRRYSSEAEPSDKASSPDQPAKDVEGTADIETTLKKDLEAKSKESLEWKDRYLRSVADFRNLQDRTARDMKSARDFAIQKFARDLVDSVDNLDRALSTVPEEKLKAATESAGDADKPEHLQDLVNLHEGLKMTESVLIQTLAKHGLVRFDPNGEKFNPNEHEATFMTPMPEKENNTVFHTQQTGFKLNGRVLRPAKVGVVKNS